MVQKKANQNRWSHKVKTVSTYPPKDLFTKDAETIDAKRVVAALRALLGKIN